MSSEKTGKAKRRNYVLAKLIVGVCLIFALFYTVDFRLLLASFRSIRIEYVALVFVFPHIAMLFSTHKWQILLSSLGIRCRLDRLFKLYMIGTFFSNFLPTMVGGDFIRSYTLYQETGDGSSVAAATFMERFLGLAVLVSLLPLAIFQEPIVQVAPLLVYFVGAVISAYALLFVLIMSRSFRQLFEWNSRYRAIDRIYKFILKTYLALQLYKSKHKTLIWCLLDSLFFYLLVASTVWAAAASFDVQIDFFYVISIVPIVLLAASVPVSLNGLGIAEAGYVFLFQLAGHSVEEGLAIALLLRFRLVATAVVGGVLFVRNRSPAIRATTVSSDKEYLSPSSTTKTV